MGRDPFAGHLLAGEKVLWSGRPRQGLMLTARDALMIPFSLMWGGFAIFWETSVVAGRAPLVFKLFGIPFVVIGLFLIFGRLPLDAWLRGRIHYALTDRRVLILRDGPWSSFKALALDRLPEATLLEGANGRGTIRFGPQATLRGGYGNGAGIWVPALDPTAQFLGIGDVRRVFAMLQERSQTPAVGNRTSAA